MQSYAEREKLMRQFRDDPAAARRVLAQCAAGLLIVTGLAWVGDFAPAVREQAAVGVKQATAQAPR